MMDDTILSRRNGAYGKAHRNMLKFECIVCYSLVQFNGSLVP